MKPSPFFIGAVVYRYILINIVAYFIQIKEFCNHSYIPWIISGHAIFCSQNRNGYALVCLKEVKPSIVSIVIVVTIIVDRFVLTCPLILQLHKEVTQYEH